MSEFHQGLESIKKIGQRQSNRTMFENIYSPLKKKIIHTKGKIRIGYHIKRKITEYSVKKIKSPVFLKTHEVFRALLLAQTRGGKTWLIRGISDRANLVGFHNVFLTDINDEMKTSSNPLQTKFYDLLSKYEEPASQKIKVYRPRFFVVHERGEIPEDNNIVQFSLKDCSLEDLVTLLGLGDDADINKRNALQAIHAQIINGQIRTPQDFMIAIDNLDGTFATQTKNSLRALFRYIIDYEILGEDYPFDSIKDMNDGYTIILNLKGFERISRNSGAPQAYVAILLRRICDARKNGLLKKPIFIYVDELARFCPKEGNLSSKKEILEAIDTMAKFGIYMIFCSQDNTNIPEKILAQCRYLLISQSLIFEQYKNIMQMIGMWNENAENIIQYNNEMRSQYQRLKKYTWILVDLRERKKKEFMSFAPLSMHMESVTN